MGNRQIFLSLIWNIGKSGFGTVWKGCFLPCLEKYPPFSEGKQNSNRYVVCNALPLFTYLESSGE